ncbi:unnamed protein product [Porites lobata]|uniref:Uncharacterized protein n=1 Tax=Porites lobata TaxID=104759 RepID=A0ABN8N025_9CNID|nr:unnamed protein product [Porites lobata]
MDVFQRIFTVFCNECVKGAVNNGVLHCESYRTMDSKKRSHVASGNTPNKPVEKRARDSRRNIRGPLDFSSENVENLEPLVSIGGFVSPKIQRRRSGGSPGIKVISSGLKKSPLVVSAIKSPVRLHRWTFYEERALVEFVGLASMDAKYGLSTSECIWPAFRPGHTFCRGKK